MIQGKTWLFLQVPKTGSTSVDAALVGGKHGEKLAAQHMTPGLRGLKAQLKPLQACTVRNTYSRAVSIWTHCTRMHNGKQGFYGFLTTMRKGGRPAHKLFARQQLFWANYCNHILTFENLEEDWKGFCEAAGLPEIELPKRNVGVYKKGRDYRDYYTPEALELVEEIWADDIAYFGHTFDDLNSVG